MNSNDHDIREQVNCVFEAIYELAKQKGADAEAIRMHEAAVVMILFNSRRKYMLRSVSEF